MLTRKLTIITGSLLLLLIWLIWQHQSPPPPPTERINLVTQQASAETAPEPSRSTTNPGPVSPLTETAPVMNNDTTTPVPAETLTWMKVYRLKRLIQQCDHQIINTLADHADAETDDVLRVLVEQMHKHEADWPSTGQLTALRQLTERCQSALEQLSAMPVPMAVVDEAQTTSSMYNLTLKQLNAWLLQLPADSAVAKGVSEALQLIHRWQADVAEVVRISKGSEEQNSQTIQALRAELHQLGIRQQEIARAIQTSNNQDQELRDEWSELFSRELQIDKEINQLRILDEDARAQALATFERSHNQLNQLLNTRNPDVFFEVQLALEQSPTVRMIGYNPYKFNDRFEFKTPFIEYVSPGDVVRQLMGVENSHWFSLVVHHATRLYHCELGADCGPTGEWITYHCLTAYVERHAESCGTSLPEFYRQLLSENHWSDVQDTRDLMRSLYAP